MDFTRMGIELGEVCSDSCLHGRGNIGLVVDNVLTGRSQAIRWVALGQ